MDLRTEIQKTPIRLQPKVLVSNLNAPIEITRQRIELRVNRCTIPSELLNGVIRFVWLPHAAFEFEGNYKGEIPELDEDEPTLFISSFSKEIPIIITCLTPYDFGWKVRGILNDCVVRNTEASAEKLVFHLVNFHDYIGQVIHDEKDTAIMAYTGRITIESEQWIGVIDSIPETEHLCKEQKGNGGFYISHVGEIRPKNGGYFDEAQLNTLCSNLHFLFGFCCGSWAGPFFPKGICENEIVWEEFAAWKTGSSQKVSSWFPTRTPISELQLFSGFMDKINDPAFRSPLCNAISWYIESNKPEIANEGRIVLMQVALEMLSWAYLVDYKHSYTEKEFNKEFHADKKIRTLLETLGICTAIPQHLNELLEYSNTKLDKAPYKDTPYILTYARNALVHSTEKNRRKLSQLNGIHLYQIAQMGIGLIELVILALCDYEGVFARRGWHGWKGEDEIPVSWTRNLL